MRCATTTTTLLALAVLLGASLADAFQDDQLIKFMTSRAMKRLAGRNTTNGPTEDDPWAEPSTFAHLTERCKIPASGSKEADWIAALPGQPPHVNLHQYAGYVKVDEENGRELFYYFVESARDASSKPLILWLNGGNQTRPNEKRGSAGAERTTSCLTGCFVGVCRAGMLVAGIWSHDGARSVQSELRRQDPEQEQVRLEQSCVQPA